MYKQKKILIVDDELAIRESLSELLEKEGYAVNTTSHAGGAAVRAQYVDCIILDLNLSHEKNMGGENILVHLWEDVNCDIPIIIYSGFLGLMDTTETINRIEAVCGKGRNIFRCIPKSSGVKQLIDAVNECLKPVAQ
jgi:CheY-like chemotaxis protein